MDNIVYTSAAALMIGIFYSAVRHMRVLYISNTKLIIRQSDQIQFLLVRLIELDKKINRIKLEVHDLNSINSSILESMQEEEKDKKEEEELLTEITSEEKNKDKDKEISFELIESTAVKTHKEKGWIRYLF